MFGANHRAAVLSWVAGALLVGGMLVVESMPPLRAAALAAMTLAAGLVLVTARRGRVSPDGSADAIESLERRIGAAARARHEMRLRAETAGRFREEFVAAVRHELKTPLNAILGFTQVLLDEIDGPLTPQQREDVTAIRQAGLYLSELVDAVLEEWVPDRAPPLAMRLVDLAMLTREVARLLEGQTVGKDVAIHVDVAADAPRPLGDARRLRQVLINLGTNALRATSRGEVTLSVTADPEGVRITVRDTGTGIPADALPKLFDEFVQVGSERRGGTGLGLALTRDLVDWHEGRIEVESQLGEGSAFHVILPLEPGE